MEVSSDSGSEPSSETQNSVSMRPWTRQEDAILLESIKKEYSENTFVTISEMLGHRTVQQVRYTTFSFSLKVEYQNEKISVPR